MWFGISLFQKGASDQNLPASFPDGSGADVAIDEDVGVKII